MASRMDRYSKTSDLEAQSGRSDRNKSLYKQIEDLDSYTNITGIATMENKNSIDIEKVKELLRSKETVDQNLDDIEVPKVAEEEEEERNYDIKDLLSKVKSKEKTEERNYRSLSTKQQKILRELNAKNKKNKKAKEIDSEDLNELLKTLSNMEAVGEIDNTDDVGLFDDLKSDTMVGDAASIKNIIDNEKEFTKDFEDMSFDKSFYTSSFGFTQRDFEELKDINHKIKKDNKFIIALLIILIIVIIIGAIVLFIK